ncbi:uncharacterized protein LOC111063367 [Nilaparvata lugens]|uniref:uncharacterized protein LOC111063367 n=1 Tax=Nilaparvata lugens TaxID=108931 RepID=UPI00193CE30F|nr:uncharacterized protein LOC111063367 [Nilaparvata lugens]
MTLPAQQRNKQELVKMRQDILDALAIVRENWRYEDGTLARPLQRLHASWLCYKEGDQCMRTLCDFMMSVPISVPGNWQALAAMLALTHNQIMSITHKQSCVRIDSAQLVIWTYSRNPNANIYKIIESLQILKRYDVLQQLKEPLQYLVDDVKLLLENDKGGFIYEYKNPTEAGDLATNEDEYLIAPKNYRKDINSLLPPSLKPQVRSNTETVGQNKQDNSAISRPVVQQETLVTRQNVPVETIPEPDTSRFQPTIFVLLTFAADGEAAARRIARSMRTAVDDRPEFGVLTLDENAQRVLDNPEMFINRVFPQFHFICPILTPGYLSAVNAPLIDNYADMDAQIEMRSATDSLDAHYVTYIYNLMVNEYTESNCRNCRVRCIIPQVDSDTQKSILTTMRRPGYLSPTLKAWAWEKDLEKFLRKLICLYD